MGAATGAVHIVSDITEKRRLEEQFRESQKFETIGTLAAGVAHDFNNLLTSIMGNASLMAADLPEGSPHAEKLDDILRSSQRAADLTKQLLAYSGKGRHFLQKVELSTLVRRIQGLIEAAVPKKVSLDLQLGEATAAGSTRMSNQIQQLILNLVSNAVEAIGEENGAITIRTGSDTAETRVHRGAGHRLRDGCGDAEQDLRSVLHDEIHGPRPGPGGGGGNRARAQGGRSG